MGATTDNGQAETTAKSASVYHHNERMAFTQVSENVPVYLHGISTRSQVIYIAVLLLISAAFVSLPFLYTAISITAPGIIRPAAEVTQITSLVSGRIASISMQENGAVRKGDVLLTLESDALIERETLLLSRLSELNQLCDDLEALISNTSTLPRLQTAVYKQSWQSFRQRLTDSGTRYRKANADYVRNRELHRGKVIADAEFENYEFARDQAANELTLLRETQLAQWQQEHRNFLLELNEVSALLEELRQEKESLRVIAAVSGTLHDVTALYPGSLVFANQPLGSISPDTALIVEAYASPSDIGLLKPGMTASFTVDAFNYNQWGMASGHITTISADVRMMRDDPVFDIRCTLDEDFLKLDNRHIGYLKKGMTLQARFQVARRSLWQLLYDRVDDWLNPVRGDVNAPRP